MSTQWMCSQCGQTNAETMHFCPACGATSSAVVRSDTNSKLVGQITKLGDRRFLWVLAVGLWIVGCAVLAVGGGIWLSRQDMLANSPAIAAETKLVVDVSTTLPDATPVPISPTTVLESGSFPNVAEDDGTSIDSEIVPTGTPISKAGDKLALPSSTPTATSSATPIPTSTPTTTSTPKPAAPPPVAESACPPGAQITAPTEGARFTQRYNYILGIANIPRFHHWQIEYSTNPNGGWNHLLERDYPVDNDKLMMLDARTVPRGPYGLRLTVVDETGNYPEPCEVWFINAY